MPRQKLTRPWTPQEFEMRREMSRTGRSIIAMTARLDRAPAPISGMLRRLGLPGAQRMRDRMKATLRDARRPRLPDTQTPELVRQGI